MHVGHLRSTILGDCLCRIFELYKNDVKRVNHLGDWGTQFGMLLNYLEETYPNWEEVKPDISDIDLFYKAAKRRFDESPEFKEQSRLKVVDLQSGEEKAVKIWQYIFKVSRDYLQIIYDRLNIQLEDFGESFYNPMLPGVLQELKDMNLCVESEGAWVVNIPGKTIPLMA